jgi:hypothetical protein
MNTVKIFLFLKRWVISSLAERLYASEERFCSMGFVCYVFLTKPEGLIYLGPLFGRNIVALEFNFFCYIGEASVKKLPSTVLYK